MEKRLLEFSRGLYYAGAPSRNRTCAPGSGVLFYMERIVFKKCDLIDKINMSGGFICEAKNG